MGAPAAWPFGTVAAEEGLGLESKKGGLLIQTAPQQVGRHGQVEGPRSILVEQGVTGGTASLNPGLAGTIWAPTWYGGETESKRGKSLSRLNPFPHLGNSWTRAQTISRSG